MTQSNDHLDTETSTSEAPEVTASPYTEIINLARTVPSRHGFWAAALASIGKHFGSPYSALHLACGSETIQEENHLGGSDPRFWAPPVQEFLTDTLAGGQSRAKLLSTKDASLKIALLAAPLVDESSGAHGAIAVVVRGGEQEAREQLAALATMAEVAASAANLVGSVAEDRSSASSEAPNRALARAATAAAPEELAFAITNSLRNKLGCEQVVLGLVAGRHIRILSISGMDDINRRSPGVARLRAAMEECLDQDTPIVCQQDTDWEDEHLASGHRLHQQWQNTAGGACVASIPLHADDRCVAIISMRRRADEPFRKDLIADITATVEPFASALLLLKRAHRGLPRHFWESGRDLVGGLLSPGRNTARIMTGLVILVATWFCFGTLEYDIVVPAQVMPALQRHLTAPYDGTLAVTHASVGDLVGAGDVLCQFDQRDLLLQKNQLEAQLAVLDSEYVSAQAGGEPVEAKLVEAKQRLIQAQLDVVGRRLAQAMIIAPYDGVIINGDLRKQVGSVLAQGTPLFEIAPLDRWQLELAVPQNVSGDVQVGLTGHFASNARPEVTQPFKLDRLRPSSEIRYAENVYVAEANIVVNSEWMRPGMEGVAKVRIGQRKVWWITLHRVFDYLRLNFWL